MLRYETTEHRWREVLESELWDLQQARNEVLPSLELSYRHMPIYLKRCFVALSLYPKGYDIHESKVIELWKLLDLLQSDGSDDEQAIGSKYYNELVERSFLKTNCNGLNDDDQHTMHNLIHDVACFLSGDEFFRLDGDTFMEIPQNARYISLHDGVSGKIPVAPPTLRAILVFPNAMVYIDNPEALFSNCEKLRVLVYHMNGIGRLMNLHTLPQIHFSHIAELRSLNKIRELIITGLGVGLNIDAAKHALLQSKKHLKFLCLEFDDYSEENGRIFHGSPNHSQNMQLLECLQPYHSLRELIVKDYKSPKRFFLFEIDSNSAQVLSIASPFNTWPPSLICLEPDRCYSLTTIPASPRLRILQIRRYDRFYELPAVDINDPMLNPFPSLECLAIICSATTRISIEPQHLPKLKKRHLSCDNLLYCDGLAELTSLEELKLWQCPRFPPYSWFTQTAATD
uniref:NB-ARC domain-containing protein n=1 Tax=Oryza punctata TaxID=4537 RepID=A0A0E0MFK4_ORYPU